MAKETEGRQCPFQNNTLMKGGGSVLGGITRVLRVFGALGSDDIELSGSSCKVSPAQTRRCNIRPSLGFHSGMASEKII